MSTIYCFSNFAKTEKSTAVPSGAGTSVTVTLKDGTSQYHPTFVLSGSYPSYNYVQWGSFYYYVVDITQVTNGIYEMECEIDKWATVRGTILASSQFVKRSASAYNTHMKDIEISNEQRVVNVAYQHTSMSSYFGGQGAYILRTISGNASNPSDPTGITTYVMSADVLKVVLNWMFTSNNVLDAAWDTVVKTVFNPFQYIVSLKYTPLNISAIPTTGTATTVSFGWWTTSSGVLP